MLAIILHELKGKIDTLNLQKELHFENIQTKFILWENEETHWDEIINANVLILCCYSPKREILRLIQELRRKKYCLPIIVLDEEENHNTEKMALKLGADRYLSKPIIYRNFAIDLKNLAFKKERIHEQKWIRVCDIYLDLERRFAKRKKHIIPLRNKEFSLLEFFMINHGKVLTRNAILEHVWDRNSNFASNTVDVHINRLRRKLEDPFKQKLIHTIPCVGYIFDRKNING